MIISKALFIGIDRYNSPSTRIKDLHGCVKDMQLAMETIDRVVGLPRDTQTVTDHEAITDRVINELTTLVDSLRPGEEGVIFDAGHGGQVPNTLQTEDDMEALDQVLVTHDFSKTAPLIDDMLHCLLNRIPSGAKLIVILDSCHSGGMPRAPLSTAEIDKRRREGWESRSIGALTRAEYSPTELRELAEHKNRNLVAHADAPFVMLSAAQAHELAWERYFNEEKHGIFTYHLCEYLANASTGVTPVEMIRHVYQQIRQYRENQMPRLTGQQMLFSQPLFNS